MLGLASLVALAAAGCKGEEAFYARDGAAFVMLGSGGDTGKGGGSGGSVGTGGAGNKGGAGGMAGMGAAGQGGAGGQPAGHYGDFCQTSDDCAQGTCQSHFCCATGTDCSGTCQTCDSTAGKTCVPVQGQMDPRADCKALATSQDTCGIEGNACNGAGACSLWPAGTPCAIAPTCTNNPAANDSVINSGICDAQGAGKCQPQITSCNNFLCEQPDGGAATGCLTSCGADTDCIKGGFCPAGNSGAGYCVGPVPNLAGNGDAEYGAYPAPPMPPYGWSVIQGGTDSASTTPHSGMYSIEETGRRNYYDGPGYYLPTGQGKYTVSFWAMQNQLPAGNADAGATDVPSGLLQLEILCNGAAPAYLQVLPPSPLPKGVWVNFTHTFDTSNPNAPENISPQCFPDGLGKSLPGDVKAAVVFLQNGSSSDPTLSDGTYPNLYIDDLVVTVPDAATHNLVGNPTFESGATDGWATNGVGTGASITVNTTGMYAHNPGTNSKSSLQLKNRSNPGTGLAYPMTIGSADYTIALYAMQNGTMSHNLHLLMVYQCLGDIAVHQDELAIQYGTSSWAELNGTYAFPPHSAPAGCKLTSASIWVTQADGFNSNGTALPCGTGSGQVECPDIFVDDVSITLTNATAPL